MRVVDGASALPSARGAAGSIELDGVLVGADTVAGEALDGCAPIVVADGELEDGTSTRVSTT
jgi:hypothetical protein